jgi:hypothetical protein
MAEFHFVYFLPRCLEFSLKMCHLDIFPFHLVVHDDCGALINFSSAGRFLLLSYFKKREGTKALAYVMKPPSLM